MQTELKKGDLVIFRKLTEEELSQGMQDFTANNVGGPFRIHNVITNGDSYYVSITSREGVLFSANGHGPWNQAHFEKLDIKLPCRT